MKSKRIGLVVMFAALAALGFSPAVAVTPATDIASAGPLTHVWVGQDLSCQVQYEDEESLQFYPASAVPGDCGTFVVTGGVLYGPDFNAHAGSATGGLGEWTPFTSVSQSAVSGAGTPASPYTVTTTVTAGLIRVTEVDRYVAGQTSYRTDVTLTNLGSGVTSATVYRAGDCYLGGSDYGYGFKIDSAKAIACSKTPNNSPADRVEQWIPLSSGASFYHEGYSTVWRKIGAKESFDDTCVCDEFVDNGAGLSWNVTVSAAQSVTVSHLTNFGREAIATTLVARPSIADLDNRLVRFPKLVANLTNALTGKPVVGALIEFYDDSTLLCTDRTNAVGNASCGDALIQARVALAGGYTAVFSGDASYLASVATAKLLRFQGVERP